MSRLRSLVAALTVAALLSVPSTPALADAFTGANQDYTDSVPLVFDVLVLRPIGLLMTAGGIMLYTFPVLPIALVTRPTQFWKPLGPLVATPARYTFSDPLGSHPSPDARPAY